LLVKEIDYSMLFRWFIGLNLDEQVWDATSTTNRDRWLEADMAKRVSGVRGGTRAEKSLTSDQHFTVDCKPLEAGASFEEFSSEGRQAVASA
jgi:hypothetical protein